MKISSYLARMIDTNILSNRNLQLISAFEKGYRIIDNKIISPKGRVLKGGKASNNKYLRFTVRDKKNTNISVHRLVAYQKFGDKMFEPGIEVRHLDTNCLNNFDWNIGIGTAKQNANDKLPSVRKNAAIIASSFIKIHNHEAIIKRRNEGLTYKELMSEFNISSGGTLHFILQKAKV